MGSIIAIDPGNIESGYVICQHNGKDIMQIIDFGKMENEELKNQCIYAEELFKVAGMEYSVAIEMIACYGMPVGKEVFQTCEWIGRFVEALGPERVKRVYRKEEKSDLCHSQKANDSTIRQALIDRYAPGVRNYGKGTKKEPGFFYGFHADVWSAMAVATTFFDKYIKGMEI